MLRYSQTKNGVPIYGLSFWRWGTRWTSFTPSNAELKIQMKYSIETIYHLQCEGCGNWSSYAHTVDYTYVTNHDPRKFMENRKIHCLHCGDMTWEHTALPNIDHGQDNWTRRHYDGRVFWANSGIIQTTTLPRRLYRRRVEKTYNKGGGWCRLHVTIVGRQWPCARRRICTGYKTEERKTAQMVKLIPFACSLIIAISGCGQHDHAPRLEIRDTRTAGYPSDTMYPWLLGGKSKTVKWRKEDNLYQAPVCGGCKQPIWTP